MSQPYDSPYHQYQAESGGQLPQGNPQQYGSPRRTNTGEHDLRVHQISNIKGEPFREAPLDNALNIDYGKISCLSYFVCILSMLDHFVFAFPFSMINTFVFQPGLSTQWGYTNQIFSIAISIGNPL